MSYKDSLQNEEEVIARIEEQVNTLPDRMGDGIYFLSALVRGINLDEHGHSLIFYERGEHHYLYDPNHGFFRLNANWKLSLKQRLLDLAQLWGVRSFRFYPLREREAGAAAPSLTTTDTKTSD